MAGAIFRWTSLARRAALSFVGPAGAVLLLAGALAAVVAARSGTDANGAVNDRRFDRRGDDGLRAPSPCGGAKLVDGANTASTSATEPPETWHRHAKAGREPYTQPGDRSLSWHWACFFHCSPTLSRFAPRQRGQGLGLAWFSW